MEGNSEFSSQNQTPVMEGKGFVMKPGPHLDTDSRPDPKTAVEMRTEATNEHAIRKLEEERERISKLTPAERSAELIEKIDKEEREFVAHFFKDNLAHRNEYSETLIITPTGSFDRQKRGNDNSPPYIAMLDSVNNSDDLYKFISKLAEENPDLNIIFENDPNGTWIKYKVTQKTS